MTLREWQVGPRPEPQQLIVQASSEDGSDGWLEHPIGMQYGFVSVGHHNFLGSHQHDLLVAFHPYTDARRRAGFETTRASIARTLHSNGFPNVSLDASSFYRQLPHFKFVASPEGNGIDCHRHYEALMAGCVPIIERHPLTLQKYHGLPVLWTADYAEVTTEHLRREYARMLDTRYDFSPLNIDHYDAGTQEHMRRRGNSWCRRLVGRDYYVIS